LDQEPLQKEDDKHITGRIESYLQGQQERNLGLRHWVQQQIGQCNVDLNEEQSQNKNENETKNENDDNADDFIFHLPPGMVDFNDSFTQSTANRDGDDNNLLNSNQQNVLKDVWANNVMSDNPYSLQNYKPYHQNQPLQQTKTAPPSLQQIQPMPLSPQRNMDLYLLQNMRVCPCSSTPL